MQEWRGRALSLGPAFVCGVGQILRGFGRGVGRAFDLKRQGKYGILTADAIMIHFMPKAGCRTGIAGTATGFGWTIVSEKGP